MAGSGFNPAPTVCPIRRGPFSFLFPAGSLKETLMKKSTILGPNFTLSQFLPNCQEPPGCSENPEIIRFCWFSFFFSGGLRKRLTWLEGCDS